MAGLITGIASLAIGGASAIFNGIAANNARKKEETKEREAKQKIEAFEKNRQAVIDQSGKIRAMKDQVFNPYAI